MKTIHTGKAIYTVTPIGHNLFGVTKKTQRGVQSTTTANASVYYFTDVIHEAWHRKLCAESRRSLRNLFREVQP